MRWIRVPGLTAIVLLLGLSVPAIAASGPPPTWIDQFGTLGYDTVDDVAADAQYAYAAGRVGYDQALPGEVSAGGTDAFVRAYEPDGTVAWTRQFGTSGFDGFPVIATTQDGVVLAGATTGQFPGQPQSGAVDVFVRRYSASGTLLSTTQFGNGSQTIALGVAASGPDT